MYQKTSRIYSELQEKKIRKTCVHIVSQCSEYSVVSLSRHRFSEPHHHSEDEDGSGSAGGTDCDRCDGRTL